MLGASPIFPPRHFEKQNGPVSELLRVGGSSVFGVTLANILRWGEARGAETAAGGPGWGRAKSVILLYLQGGPSHLDLWDPKPTLPDAMRSAFAPIDTQVPGIQLMDVMPKLAAVADRLTLIRSMSYTPIGLLNHTAAMYQMLTGYTADKVSPSGQLEPPSPKDFPNVGSNVVRLLPPAVPMLPFVMLPRPLQESNVIGKAGTAGFLGRAYDPYYLYPAGNDGEMDKLDRVKADDLQLRPEVSPSRLGRRARLRELIDDGMPAVKNATARYDLDAYYDKALELVLSGRAREAFDLRTETAALRDRYGRNTFGQSCLLARRLIEAGTRFVEVNWPSVANSGDPHRWDHHTDLSKQIRSHAGPMLDAGLSTLIADLDDRGLLAETLVVAVGEFGRSPKRGVNTSGNGSSDDGRDHWPYCYTACVAGAGVRRGFVYGRSDGTGSAPLSDPVQPGDLLATIYHSLGIDPATIVYNHLNQPRELVKGQAITGLMV
ncbi:MAG: DUF1501 domain-containing protein [Planctomycetia bacterium]|nr:DUF1501 domain-containing protein [Planctomycetia bacterium]